MKLYIVGNGFDLNHGRKTSYWDYRNHLLEKYPDLVNKFDTMEHTRGAEVDVNSRSGSACEKVGDSAAVLTVVGDGNGQAWKKAFSS